MNKLTQDGPYKVIANCCLIGLCMKCKDTREPVRVTVTEGHSKEYAEKVAKAFATYEAEVKEK